MNVLGDLSEVLQDNLVHGIAFDTGAEHSACTHFEIGGQPDSRCPVYTGSSRQFGTECPEDHTPPAIELRRGPPAKQGPSDVPHEACQDVCPREASITLCATERHSLNNRAIHDKGSSKMQYPIQFRYRNCSQIILQRFCTF